MNKPTLAALAHGLCWAIEPLRGEALLSDISEAAPATGAVWPYPEALVAYGLPSSSSADDRPYVVIDGIAVIPIVGAMTKGRSWYYSGTSTALTRMVLNQAAADEKVKGILLYVDSPGGSIDGIQELADAVKAAAAKKSVTAFFEDTGCSAAYWAACTATRLVMNAAGTVGSLGIMAMLVDTSEAAAQAGIKFILMKTGPLKGAGSRGLPVDDAAKAMYQRIVDDAGDRFASTVATARNKSADQMKAIFTGDMFGASRALELGLVDAVGTLEDAMADLVAGLSDDDSDSPVASTAPGADPRSIVQVSAQAARPTPTISAPGGHPGLSAGNTNAPTSGAENTPKGKPPMSFRQNLLNALAVRGFGKMVVALNGTTSEDPEVIARIVTEQVEAQASDLVAQHPLITVAAAHGVTDLPSFNAFHERARNGDRYLEDTRSDAKMEAVRAFGPESGAIVGVSVDGQSLAQALASRNAWRKMADERVGISPDGSAPGRRSAPTAQGADAEGVGAGINPTATAWERLSDAQRATGKALGHDTDQKREAYAKNLLQEAA